MALTPEERDGVFYVLDLHRETLQTALRRGEEKMLAVLAMLNDLEPQAPPHKRPAIARTRKRILKSLAYIRTQGERAYRVIDDAETRALLSDQDE